MVHRKILIFDALEKDALCLFDLRNALLNPSTQRPLHMFIQIGGIPGVGKTTINKNVEYLAKKHYLKVDEFPASICYVNLLV